MTDSRYVLELDYQSVKWAGAGDKLPTRPDDEDRYLSQDQLDHLAAVLCDVPQLIEDLEVAVAKDVRFPTRTVHGDGSEAPVMINVSASDARTRLERRLLASAAFVWRQMVPSMAPRFRDAVEAAEWLHSALGKLALQPDAEQTARSISSAARRALNVIEHPKTIRYLGECPDCGADVEAEDGDTYVTCNNQTTDAGDQCPWTDEVDAVIRQAILRSRDALFTDSELVGVFELNDRQITRNQINSWARSGRLTAHEHKRWDNHAQKIVTRRTYRLSEVEALVGEMSRKRQQRAKESA